MEEIKPLGHQPLEEICFRLLSPPPLSFFCSLFCAMGILSECITGGKRSQKSTQDTQDVELPTFTTPQNSPPPMGAAESNTHFPGCQTATKSDQGREYEPEALINRYNVLAAWAHGYTLWKWRKILAGAFGDLIFALPPRSGISIGIIPP